MTEVVTKIRVLIVCLSITALGLVGQSVAQSADRKRTK